MKKILLLFSFITIAISSHAQDTGTPNNNQAQVASYIEQGNAKATNGDWSGAFNLYNNALALDNKNAIAYGRRGVARQNLKDYRGAITDFSKAIYLNNSDADSYYGRGICFYTIGEKQKCCFDLTKAIELGNNDALTAQQNYCN